MADATTSARQWDLIPKLAPFLDRHLVLPLLEFLEEKQIYPLEEIKRAKLELLASTNMVDFAIDIQTSLGSNPNTEELTAKKDRVLAQMHKLQSEAAPLLELLGKPDQVKLLKEGGNLNKLSYLSEHHGVTEGAIKSLYALAKHMFECGVYEQAATYLALVRDVTTEAELLQNVLWGKLAANVLLENWEAAVRDVMAIKETIEARAFANPIGQLQQRAWLLHWSLPIFFNSAESRQTLLEFYHHERTWQVVQISCPHLLRYIIVGSIITKRRFPKEIVKYADQESYTYSDPVTKFIESLYGLTDFEAAETHLALCSSLFDVDPHLILVKKEFMENCRYLIFELFCKLHNTIDTQLLASKLNMSPEKSEEWIVHLIRGAKLDAKIDTQAHQILIGSSALPLYQQLIDRTRPLIRPLGPVGPSSRRSHRDGQQQQQQQQQQNRPSEPKPSASTE